MPTINDFISNNDDCPIVVKETPSREDVGIFNNILYEGYLHNIPNELKHREVIHEAYMLKARVNALYILCNNKS